MIYSILGQQWKLQKFDKTLIGNLHKIFNLVDKW